MEIDKGFIFLHRSLLEHQIFASEKLLKIWIWCLCKANYKTKFVPLRIGKGQITVEVKRGQFIFGRHKAEEELFIDGSTIYKCIQKLASFESISIESNNQYSIITICNYDSYNEIIENLDEKVTTNEQLSNNQQTTNEQPKNTTNKDNKDNKDKNKKQYPPEILEFTKKLIPYFDKTLVDSLSKEARYKWVDTIHKLVTIEKQTFEQIEMVVKHTRNDTFWVKNFNSLAKLRQKNKEDIMFYFVFQQNMKNTKQPITNNQQQTIYTEKEIADYKEEQRLRKEREAKRNEVFNRPKDKSIDFSKVKIKVREIEC